jgi:hypothetical protein
VRTLRPHPSVLSILIGGRLSESAAECASINEARFARGTRIYLWPKFSPSTPLRATSSALDGCIWRAIAKLLVSLKKSEA